MWDLRLPSCLILPYENNLDPFWRYRALERKRTSKPREIFGLVGIAVQRNDRPCMQHNTLSLSPSPYRYTHAGQSEEAQTTYCAVRRSKSYWIDRPVSLAGALVLAFFNQSGLLKFKEPIMGSLPLCFVGRNVARTA